jgi:hypothetical protein
VCPPYDARPIGVLPVMILLTVTVTPLYWGDRYGHHDQDGAPAARMGQRPECAPVPADYRIGADPLTGYKAITAAEQLQRAQATGTKRPLAGPTSRWPATGTC